MSSMIPMLPNEFARLTPNGVECRADPMRVHLDFSDLHARDQHDLNCGFDCSVRIADSASDRRMLAEVLLANRSSISAADIANQLAKSSRSRVEAFVREHDVNELIEGESRKQLIDELRVAIDAAAFACGLIVLPPFQLEMTSASLQRDRLAKHERDRAEAKSAEQVEHLRRAGELIKQFHAIRESATSVNAGQILQQIAPGDRGQTLEALLLASSQSAPPKPLWAVAGNQLVKIDFPGQSAGDSVRMDAIGLSAELGPFRSVSCATIDGVPQLLIGAQTGVMIVDPSSPNTARLLAVSGQASHGFSAVAFDPTDRTIWATHHDFGLRRWTLDTGDAINFSEPTREAKHVRTISDAIVWSSGSTLIIRSRDGSLQRITAGSSPIVNIESDDVRCLTIHQDGAIASIELRSGQRNELLSPSNPVCDVAALPWLGSIRLLLSRETGAIDCIGIDDQLVTQYRSTHSGCRTIAASADLVAAVSSDRQRLIFWHAWDGRKPFAELHLTSQVRHRIADIAFA